jgi:hypothetical protein
MDIILIGKVLALTLKWACPYKTGNLKSTIISTVSLDGTFTISMGGEKAPYAPYVNEKWISPKWNGKSNPNEKWWENTVRKSLRIFTAENVLVLFKKDGVVENA